MESKGRSKAICYWKHTDTTIISAQSTPYLNSCAMHTGYSEQSSVFYINPFAFRTDSVNYLCKRHIHLHSRPRPYRTRRIILVRTSPRAFQTPCGSSVPLCRLHRPGNSRSHPGLSVCSAEFLHTDPRCIALGS